MSRRCSVQGQGGRTNRPTTKPYQALLYHTIYTTPNISYHTISLCIFQTAYHQNIPYHKLMYIPNGLSPKYTIPCHAIQSIPYHPYHTTLLSLSQPLHHQTISRHNLLYHTLTTILKDGCLTVPLNLSCQL